MVAAFVSSLVVLYFWAGLSVFLLAKKDMHEKEASVCFFPILFFWPLIPFGMFFEED